MPAASPSRRWARRRPWFILGIMLFSFAVRAVYVESCSMFTRGGVYRVVKEALGGSFAKLSVSALMFDYILTGPISGVSAGQYITGLMNELLTVANNSHWLPPALMDAHNHPFQFDMNSHRGGICGRGDHLLLVAERQGHRGVQRQGSARHADHHGDGGDSVAVGQLTRYSCGALTCPHRPYRPISSSAMMRWASSREEAAAACWACSAFSWPSATPFWP